MNINTPLETHIPALRKLWREAFGDTEAFLDAFFTTAFSMDHSCITTVNEEVAAALYWIDCQHMGKRIAYLYAVATAGVFRGQGIFHKLMDDTHLHLAEQGYDGTILVPGNKELFKLYQKMGYEICSYIREFRCVGATMDVQLSPIDKTEYARLRRQWLPEGGVIQENKNLDFLQTQAYFYAGSDFLLAARREAGTLYGVELLGDDTMAPGIVQALGYTEGRFRTPGESIPFAMYRPLRNSTLLPPTYFGLAFD